MGKLIDRDVAIQKIQEFAENSDYVMEHDDAERILRGLPDMDPVHAVGGCWCCECEFVHGTGDIRDCVLTGLKVKPGDFCSHGSLRL